MTDAAERPFRLPIALACVALGAGLYGWLVVAGGFGAPPPERMAGADPRLTFIFTPVYALPLVGYAVWTGRLRLWPAIGLIAGLTVIHGAAQIAASINYLSPEPTGLQRLIDTSAEREFRQAHRAEMFTTARYTAIRGGLTAGALGAGLGILLTAFCLRLKSLHVWEILAAVLLTGLAAFSLSDLPLAGLPTHLPHARPPIEWVWRVFAPWQLLFGATLVLLMRRVEPKLAVEPPQTLPEAVG